MQWTATMETTIGEILMEGVTRDMAMAMAMAMAGIAEVTVTA